MAWFNADGLNIKHGRENVRDNGIVASIKTFGSEGELQIKFDLATMTAGTQFTTDRDNDDTLDGFNIGDVHLPDGAVIESAAIYMTDEAAAGGTSVAVGTFQVDGTAIDNDGLVTAANGATANLTANNKQAGSGAQVGAAVTEKAYVGLVTVGTFTAGVGTVVIKYSLPRLP